MKPVFLFLGISFSLLSFAITDGSSVLSIQDYANDPDHREIVLNLSLDSNFEAAGAYALINQVPECQPTQEHLGRLFTRCYKRFGLSTGEGFVFLDLKRIDENKIETHSYSLTFQKVLQELPRNSYARFEVKNLEDEALLLEVLKPAFGFDAARGKFRLTCRPEYEPGQRCYYSINGVNAYYIGRDLLSNNGKRVYVESVNRGTYYSSVTFDDLNVSLEGKNASRLLKLFGIAPNPQNPYQHISVMLSDDARFSCVRSQSSGKHCSYNFSRRPFPGEISFPETLDRLYQIDLSKGPGLPKGMQFTSEKGILKVQCSENGNLQTCRFIVKSLGQ